MTRESFSSHRADGVVGEIFQKTPEQAECSETMKVPEDKSFSPSVRVEREGEWWRSSHQGRGYFFSHVNIVLQLPTGNYIFLKKLGEC